MHSGAVAYSTDVTKRPLVVDRSIRRPLCWSHTRTRLMKV